MPYYPDFRRSDKSRTRIGNAIVNYLPVVAVRPNGSVALFLGRCRAGNAVMGKEIARFDRFGIHIGVYRIGPKPWGLTQKYGGMFGYHFGRWR